MADSESLFAGRQPSLSESQLIASIEASAGGTSAEPSPRVVRESGHAAKGSSCPPGGSLADHMRAVRNTLTAAHNRTVAILDSRLEAVRGLEAEAAELRKENCSLRTWIASAGLQGTGKEEMAGTGETSAHADGVPWDGQQARATHFGEAAASDSALRIMSEVGLPPQLESGSAFMKEPPVPPNTVFPLVPGATAAGMEEVQAPTLPELRQVPEDSDVRFSTDSALSTTASSVNMGNGSAVWRETEISYNGGSIRNSLPMNKRFRKLYTNQFLSSPTCEFGAMGGGAPPPMPAPRRRSLFNRGAFMQADELKERIRKAIGKEEYTVGRHYKEQGCCQEIARSNRFEQLTLLVIGVNAIWLAVDADLNDSAVLSDAPIPFQIMEHLFCGYFTFEITIRFLAFKSKALCVKDPWFRFDACLAVLMIFETWVLTVVFKLPGTAQSMLEGNIGNSSMLRILRLVRLVRMARMAKLVRLMPELMILIKGLIVATQTVFYTLCLLLLIVYIFAIGFMQLTKGTPLQSTYFKSMGTTMKTLVLSGILPDQAPFVEVLSSEHAVFALAMLLFILIGSLTVMNMLVGVLVEVVKTVSSVEKEQMDVTFVKNHLLTYLKRYDSNEDTSITKAEFEALLETPEAAKALQNIGVDVVGLVDFLDYIFADEQRLSSSNIMEAVLQLRGSNTATVRDIVNLRKFMAQELSNIDSKLYANSAKQPNVPNRLVLAQQQPTRPARVFS